MKILHPLLCYYPSQAGGPANTLYWLNKSLDADQFSCEVVSTDFGLIEDLKATEFSTTHKASFISSKGKPFISQSIKELKTSDIIQFSSIFFSPTLPLLISALSKNKAVIISPRGELYDAAIRQKSLKKKIWLSVIKRFQNKINFHATNAYELKIIQKVFPKAKSYTTIPNYMEMPIKLNNEVENKLVFVGRINPIKNIHILIDAISIVHKGNSNIKLEILGFARLDYEKEYLSSLQKKVELLCLENVVLFKGHIDGEAKNKVIASSKALILPSKSENFGNVVLEALAQGTPVIASKNTPWEILNEYNAGYWIDGSAEEIAKSILEVLNLNYSGYLNMRENAFELCKTKFDIKTNIKVWENYYKKITKNVQK